MLRRWRLRQRTDLSKAKTDEEKQAVLELRQALLDECRDDICFWINHFIITYDPRRAEKGEYPYIPFDLWPKQEDYLRWVEQMVAQGDEFLAEKSRDVGVSWLNGMFAEHRWLFHPGFQTTFGANKEDSVDRLGDPKSIFEKIRLSLYRLPDWMMPKGFSPRKHDNHMRILNPANGNAITGESGDNMGRGGRSTLYFVDEAAHVERADRVDAAIVAVANARGWVSSVYGMGGLFARKRNRLPPERVFTFHFRDDPRKDKAWEAKARAEIDPVVFAQEYDIDYTASVEGICIPAKWVQSAQRLAEIVDYPRPKKGTAGVDVGGEGKSKSVWCGKFGPHVQKPEARNDGDTTGTALWALELCQAHGIDDLRFDSVGVGEGVKSTLRDHSVEGLMVTPVNTGEPPSDTVWADERTSEEMFTNSKAEIWWTARQAFKRSHERLLWELGEEGGIEHPIGECVLMPDPSDRDSQTLAHQLSLPKFFRNEKGKILIEGKKQLAKRGIASPDYAEAYVLNHRPAEMGVQLLKITGY